MRLGDRSALFGGMLPRRDSLMHASAFVLALCLGLGLAGAISGASPAQAADEQPAYGPELEGFDYPWPVSHFSLTSQGEELHMAYMDVKPSGDAERQDGGAVSRQEFLRGHLAGRRSPH